MFSKSSGLFVLERVYHSDPIVNKCLFRVCLCYCHLLSACSPKKRDGETQRTPSRKGESPKEEEERGQSKVGGPSPLSFRVVLLGVVMLSHRSLVWRFFPFLGGAVFSFGWCCFLPSFGWCCFRSPSPLSGVPLSFFFGWCCFLPQHVRVCCSSLLLL